jgi:hypothetical protein
VPSTFAGNKAIRMIRVFFVSFQMLCNFYITIELKSNNDDLKFNDKFNLSFF